MSSLIQDIMFGVRVLRKNPTFSLVAVTVIALGIGANTAIFSVVNTVLIRSLPYRDQDRIVMIWEDATVRGGRDRVATAPANFLDWKSRADVFTDLAALRNESLRLTEFETPLVPLTHLVTPNFFDVLGVEPHLGRTFAQDEDKPGKNRVAVISYPLWQRVFGADPEAVGRKIQLDSEPYTLIGVLPRDFYSAHLFSTQPDLWVPLDLSPRSQDRRDRRLVVFGRLATGRTLGQAQASMSAIAATLAREHPETNRDWKIRVQTVHEDVVGDFRSTFVLLVSAVGFVLLIACANVASLVLTRASQRSREIAVRFALGARRGRVLRQILTENMILAGFGGTFGFVIAWWAVQPMARLIPSQAGVPFISDIRVDSDILAFTMILTLLSGIFFGLAPAWQASRWDLNCSLKEGGRGSSAGLRTKSVHRWLVVSQVAISLLLITGAGLMLQSFRQLVGFESGFEVDELLTLRNSLRGEEYRDPISRIQHFERLAEHLEGIPGVTSVSGVSFIPPTLTFNTRRFQIEGETFDEGFEPSAALRSVLPDYFSTMGIAQRSGRGPSASDTADSEPVVFINEALASRHFPEDDPLGRYLTIEDGDRVPRQVVGIVGNVRSQGIDPEPLPVLYVPHAQRPVPIMSLMLRTSAEPRTLSAQAEREAWSMNRNGNIYGVLPMSEVIEVQHWRTRLSARVLISFASLALFLGAIGIYAVISSSVSTRVQEIGVRMALGAMKSDINRLVLGEGIRLAVFGIIVGLLGSAFLIQLISSQLYGISATDPLTFLFSVLVLLGVAGIACLAPAIRAMRTDPLTALRSE